MRDALRLLIIGIFLVARFPVRIPIFRHIEKIVATAFFRGLGVRASIAVCVGGHYIEGQSSRSIVLPVQCQSC